eukprot:m.167111 g.167111  ORF g.167111 m.167111 type:complete len:852 (-) comp12780_c0_seq1:171-2726(-)
MNELRHVLWGLVLVSFALCATAQSGGCYPEGYYEAVKEGSYTPMYYVSIEPSPPSPRRVAHHPSEHVDIEAMSRGAAVGRSAKLRCMSQDGKCPWNTGTCQETPTTFLKHGTMSCTFDKGSATAIIEKECDLITNLTDAPGVFLYKHHDQRDQCAHYVNDVACQACDCSTSDKCVACSMQYHTMPSYNYYFSYDCINGSSPLEELRQVCNATVGRQPSPIVPTAAGDIQGFKDPDSLHYVFRGIPFAAPPVGKLRFRPPQPPAPWDTVLNATEYGNTCIQRGPAWQTLGGVRGSTGSSEDCLYLNVFSPAKYVERARSVRNGALSKESATLAPVLIYFPAGQFMWGSGNDAENFNAPQTAAGGEVVVITANYRLGAFGYLGLEALRSRDPAGSMGNYGSLDQRAVLEWIHTNIEAFGGDPNNVVLWGESAGAAAVTAHLSMEGSFPYFHKAILESGAFNGWSYRTASDAEANAFVLAKNLGCLNQPENVTVNVTCLETVDADTMISMDDDGAGEASVMYNQEGQVVANYSMPFMDTIDKSLWSPVIDGVVLKGTPVSLLREGRTADVPIILGTNRDEGSTFTGNLSGTGDGFHTPDSFYNSWLYSVDQVDFYSSAGRGGSSYATMMLQNKSQFIEWTSGMFGANMTATLVDMYQPGTVSDLGIVMKDWWWSVSGVVGDFVLTCPARRAVRTIEQQTLTEERNNSAWVFFFDHTPNISVNQAATYLWGAFHGSEVPFVWYDTFELALADERALSATMVQYWVNFAWTGDPNEPPPEQAHVPALPAWEPYTSSTDNTIVFGDGKLPGLVDNGVSVTATGTANVSIITGLKKDKCDFWDAFPTQWTNPTQATTL